MAAARLGNWADSIGLLSAADAYANVLIAIRRSELGRPNEDDRRRHPKSWLPCRVPARSFPGRAPANRSYAECRTTSAYGAWFSRATPKARTATEPRLASERFAGKFDVGRCC
jgi:hypothetical protein